MRRRHFALVLAAALAACSGSTQPKPGKPITIAISAGDGQTAAVGAQLPAPIAVKITDDGGRGVPGVPVDFLITSGGGQLSALSATTNGNGIATTRWTLGTNTAASPQVTAQLIDPATGALLASVMFHATAKPGPPAFIYADGGDNQVGFEATALSEPIVAVVRDEFGNGVPNVAVTFAVLDGGGSVSPSAATTGANGHAQATWTLGPYGQPQRATAVAAALTKATFFATSLRQVDGTSVSLGGRPFGVAVSAHDVVYVTRLDAAAVTRFNGTATTVAATITVGLTPTDVTFDPSGTRAYVANQSSQSVSIVNAATNAVEGTIPVTGDPFRVLVSPDATRLYVITNANVVYAIDLSTKAVVGQIGFGATPNGLAITADGSKLYVGTRAGQTVVEVSTSTMTALRTFTPGGTIQEVQLAPDGSELYTVNEEGSLFVYTLASGTLAATINLGSGSGAFGAAITPSPDRTKLFVSLMWSGEVTVIDRATRAVTKTFYVGGTPRRMAFTANGTAVVANESGYVTWLK